MDPDGYDRKAATAPPAGWNHDEKAALTNPAPPAYQDVPAAGYPQPGQGYPQPGQGYPQPGQGYPQPGQGYPQPGQGYPQQPQGYGNPPQYGGAPGQPYPAMPGQQYPPQPGATVTIQPTVYVSRPPLAHPVNDYMGYSIFTMLCCCLPLGIAALIYSISAREANLSGDQLVAERNSRTSRTLNHVSLGIGITVFILTIIYMVVVAGAFH